MKLNSPNEKRSAMTSFEALVVVVCLLLLAALLLPLLGLHSARHIRSGRILCVSNLRQINLAFRIWEGDNNNRLPMAVSVTNGGGREMLDAGNVGGFLQVVSNEFTTTKILICPADHGRTFATNWSDLNASHISYFFSMDATNGANPAMVLDGDDNLIVGGMPAKSGIQKILSNSPVFWSQTRHVHVGNLGFVDGSVAEEPTNGLEMAFQRTGLATNRIAIP